MEQTHTDTQAFSNSSANKINFCLGYIGNELEQPLAFLPQLTVMFSQTSESAQAWSELPPYLRSSRGPGKKYTHTHTQLLTEVQCIVMKIKDILITAAKWYWTSVNAREGTSKNEDSWTSHKTKSLSAYVWGCKWGTRAPDSWTRNGSTLLWTRWLGRESSTSPSHIRPTNPQLLCSTWGSASWGISVHLDGI